MPLTLMYLTGDPQIAQIAETSGVDWIFVDLEILGKQERQGHLDTVISGHTMDDLRAVRDAVSKAQVLVRVNPIYAASSAEIEEVISIGADIIMLPYFTNSEEVAEFVGFVDGRARTCLLVETPAAVENIDKILAIDGIDYVHIGLNDLHLGYGLNFMFDLLANGTVESLCNRIKQAGIPYGFGGIARLGHGLLPAEAVIAEHYRLGSSMAILSRSFCDVQKNPDVQAVSELFTREVANVRHFEETVAGTDERFFEENRKKVLSAVSKISEQQASLRTESAPPMSRASVGQANRWALDSE